MSVYQIMKNLLNGKAPQRGSVLRDTGIQRTKMWKGIHLPTIKHVGLKRGMYVATQVDGARYEVRYDGWRRLPNVV